jgi:hypothetical protein
MARLSVRWLLERQSVYFLIIGVCLAIPLVWLEIEAIWALEFHISFSGLLFLPIGIGVFFAICLLRLIGNALGNLLWLNHHSCLKGLSRYGPVKPLVDEIERELADGSGVVRIGTTAQSLQLFGDLDTALHDAEVWLTPSWLIYIPSQGTDLVFFRFDSLVSSHHDGMTLNLFDRFEVRWQIPGTVDGLTHLAAEILVRVPWVLSRFDAETERRWNENRQEVLAEVDQRRAQFRIADSSLPGNVLQSRNAPGSMEP